MSHLSKLIPLSDLTKSKHSSVGDAMRVSYLASFALAVSFCAVSHANCQTPDETPGQVLPIQTNVGTGYNCGRVSSPLYCYGIPVNMGTGSSGNGSFWLDTYTTG